MQKEKSYRICILGFNRYFDKEPRMRNELEVFRDFYKIQGYGLSPLVGIDSFVEVRRIPTLLRRFVLVLGAFFPSARIAFEKFYYRNLIKSLNKINYSFLISHGIDDSIIASYSIHRFAFHSNEYLPLQFDGSLIFRLTEIRYRKVALRRILNQASIVVTEGDTVANKYVTEFAIDRGKFIVMPSMPRFHNFNSIIKSSNAHIKLIHHGILAPVRGIDLLVELISKLDSRFSLTLMGPGPLSYINKLKAKAARLGNLTIVDPVEYEEIVTAIHEYDLGLVIFGSPHYHHKYTTVPNKFWECLQARIPVLVSPISAMAEIVRKSGCGIVAPAPTIEGYLEAIRVLTKGDILKMKKKCEDLSWLHSRDSWLETYRLSFENKMLSDNDFIT